MSFAAALKVRTSFEIEFDRAGPAFCSDLVEPALHLPVPWLGGHPVEQIFAAAEPERTAAGFVLRRAGSLLLGCTVQPVGASLQAATGELYRRLLGVVAGRPLYRVWNYVPAINEVADGMENYRAFCAGRAEAFESALGAGYRCRLPAASAVGCGGDALAAVFVAGETAPHHVENPLQVPAYDYPPEHGPRAPSFARATVAGDRGRTLVFVSGTAAIRGHRTVAPGRLLPQLTCTLENLRRIGREAGVGDQLGAGGFERHFKIYVRRAEDYVVVRSCVERALLEPGDRAIYLRADICRADLELEIEATLLAHPTPNQSVI